MTRAREFAGRLGERIALSSQAIEQAPTGAVTGPWKIYHRCRAAVEPEGAGAEREGMALSAMARFRFVIRYHDAVRVGDRIEWRKRQFVARSIVEDPEARDRLTIRTEEVRA